MKSFLPKRRASPNLALQITSMADVFLILLVFLLKSYASSFSHLATGKSTRLPVAAALDAPRDGLKLEIQPGAVLLDDKPVVTLAGLGFPVGAAGEEAARRLDEKFAARRASPRAPNSDANLLVFADERVPYETVSRVLASAARSGFVDLQLVVVQNR